MFAPVHQELVDHPVLLEMITLALDQLPALIATLPIQLALSVYLATLLVL